MKNKLIAVAFMLLMNHIIYSQSDNYLNNSGFEQYNSCGNDLSSGCDADFDNSCSVSSEGCQNWGNDWQSYFDKCPGGINSVKRKMQDWTDRCNITTPNSCEFCGTHCADWQYQPIWYAALPAELSGSGFNCFDGSGCMGSNLYAMFQQGLSQTITNNGSYMVSGWVLQANSGSNSTHNMHFIFSPNQPNYADGSCQTQYNELPNGYATINNVTGGQSIDFLVDQNDLLDWTYVEAPLQFGSSGSIQSSQNLNWFSVATDMNASVAGTVSNSYDASYFAFDDFYVSDAVCYCPLIRLLQNQTLQAPTVIRAQEYIRAGTNVGLYSVNGLSTGPVIVSSGGIGETIFRAGNYISLEPGFEVLSGAVFETQIRGCYDNSNNPSLITAATGFSPNCDGYEDQFCFITQDASSWTLDVYGQDPEDFASYEIGPMVGQIPYNPVTNQNEVCVDIPFNTPGTEEYLYFLTLTGCNGVTVYIDPATFIAQDVIVGCKKILNTTQPTLHSADNDSSNTSFAKKNVQIYPNPTCENVTVKVSSFTPTDRITINDVNGNLVKEYDCTSLISEYNISTLADGIYIVSYISNNSSSTQKITKICQ